MSSILCPRCKSGNIIGLNINISKPFQKIYKCKNCFCTFYTKKK